MFIVFCLPRKPTLRGSMLYFSHQNQFRGGVSFLIINK